jgi:hypothetical protein
MTSSDDPSGNDPGFDKFAEEYERRQTELYQMLSDYMEEEDFDEEYAAHLLLDMTVRMRMTAYGLGVANPSVSGLKLDLDRFKREVDDFVREARKGAEDYIAQVKDARARAEAEEDPNSRN